MQVLHWNYNLTCSECICTYETWLPSLLLEVICELCTKTKNHQVHLLYNIFFCFTRNHGTHISPLSRRGTHRPTQACKRLQPWTSLFCLYSQILCNSSQRFCTCFYTVDLSQTVDPIPIVGPQCKCVCLPVLTYPTSSRTRQTLYTPLACFEGEA